MRANRECRDPLLPHATGVCTRPRLKAAAGNQALERPFVQEPDIGRFACEVDRSWPPLTAHPLPCATDSAAIDARQRGLKLLQCRPSAERGADRLTRV